MSANPFDDEAGSFYVLVNEQGQHSLWPCFAELPNGWHTTFGPSPRPECLEFVDSHWVDMRPQRPAAERDISETV